MMRNLQYSSVKGSRDRIHIRSRTHTPHSSFRRSKTVDPCKCMHPMSVATLSPKRVVSFYSLLHDDSPRLLSKLCSTLRITALGRCASSCCKAVALGFLHASPMSQVAAQPAADWELLRAVTRLQLSAHLQSSMLQSHFLLAAKQS